VNPSACGSRSTARGGLGEPAGPYEHAALGDLLVRSGLSTPEQMLKLERGVQDGEGDLLALIAREGDLGDKQLQEAIDLLTQNTMFTLLRWTQGSFHFTAQPVAGEGDSARGTPAEQILMDALRMVDEWRTFDPDARDFDTVWRRSEAFDLFRERAVGESPARLARAASVFSHVDGRASGRRVVDLSRLGEFEGVDWLSRLRRAGVIEPLARQSARPSRRPSLSFAGSRSPRCASWRRSRSPRSRCSGSWRSAGSSASRRRAAPRWSAPPLRRSSARSSATRSRRTDSGTASGRWISRKPCAGCPKAWRRKTRARTISGAAAIAFVVLMPEE